MSMTRTQALAYKKRWQLVEEHEQMQLNQQTVDEKFEILAMLYTSAKELGWSELLQQEDAAVWKKWQQLREKLCDQKK